MARRAFRVLALIAVLSFISTLWCAEKKSLTILHTNDTHSTLFPYGPSGKWAGISRMSRKIKEIKAGGENVLVLNSGDVFVGTFEFNKYRGYSELKIMEGLYDAMGLGNHEFDLGIEGLLGSLNGKTSGGQPIMLPIICANLNLDSAPALRNFVKPFIIKQVGGLRVGLTGIVETRHLDFSAEVIPLLSDPLKAAGEAVAILRNIEHADIVICLSHLGKRDDVGRLSQVPGIDIIIGGHSHDALFQPVVANGKIIVQAGEFGRYLGELTVEYDGKQVKLTRHRLYSIDRKVGNDPALTPVLDSLRAGIVGDPRYGPVYTKQVATAAQDLEERWPPDKPERDTALGNLITDGIRKAATEAGYEVDFALEANGYIGHRIYKGKVVGNDVMRAVPYGYDPATGLGFKIDVVRLAGAQILAGLEYSVSMVEDTDDVSMQVSGLTFEYDSSRKPIGPDKLIGELSRGGRGRVDPRSVKINGKPMDLKEVYGVALTNGLHKFMKALGLEPLASKSTEISEYMAVRDYMAGLRTLKYTAEGRIIDTASKAKR